jgi:hypothetical protein
MGWKKDVNMNEKKRLIMTTHVVKRSAQLVKINFQYWKNYIQLAEIKIKMFKLIAKVFFF